MIEYVEKVDPSGDKFVAIYGAAHLGWADTWFSESVAVSHEEVEQFRLGSLLDCKKKELRESLLDPIAFAISQETSCP